METIDVVKANKLVEITKKVALLLTKQELNNILLVYAGAFNRLEQEITMETDIKEDSDLPMTKDEYESPLNNRVENILFTDCDEYYTNMRRGYKTMIYTTYLSKLKDIPKEAIKVLIARKAPAQETLDKYNCMHALSLAPTQFLLNQYKEDGNFDKFKKIFVSEKKVVTFEEHDEIEKILELCKENDVYLICYEKDYEKCHRSIIAELISNKMNIPWQEAEL